MRGLAQELRTRQPSAPRTASCWPRPRARCRCSIVTNWPKQSDRVAYPEQPAALGRSASPAPGNEAMMTKSGCASAVSRICRSSLARMQAQLLQRDHQTGDCQLCRFDQSWIGGCFHSAALAGKPAPTVCQLITVNRPVVHAVAPCSVRNCSFRVSMVSGCKALSWSRCWHSSYSCNSTSLGSDMAPDV